MHRLLSTGFSAAIPLLVLASHAARADIVRWDNGQVIAGTTGINPGPGIDLGSTPPVARQLQFANLAGVSLAGSTFSGSNLDSASFISSQLDGVNLAGATIRSAAFDRVTGMTRDMMYATKSFAQRDLAGSSWQGMNLTGWAFSRMNVAFGLFGPPVNIQPAVTSATNLSWAHFVDASLYGGSLAQANVSGALMQRADLTLVSTNGTIFRSADLRGAVGWVPASTANVTNVIRPDGTVEGLNVETGENFVVRNSAIPVTIRNSASVGASGIMQFMVENGWSSPVSFETGITPSFLGTLILSVKQGLDPTPLVGQSYQVFNWSTVPPVNARFGQILNAPGLTFDTSELYITGRVTLTGVEGGSIPEPGTLGLLSLGVVFGLSRRIRVR